MSYVSCNLSNYACSVYWSGQLKSETSMFNFLPKPIYLSFQISFLQTLIKDLQMFKVCRRPVSEVLPYPAGRQVLHHLHLQQELLRRRQGHPQRQPPGADMWHGVSHIRPLCWRLQPRRLRGGPHQHRRPSALCCGDVQEDEDCPGPASWCPFSATGELPG